MTTLPLFWDLSSASKKDRIGASIKLVSSLQQFQTQFVPKPASEQSDSEEPEEEDVQQAGDGLDACNAQDVAYSIRRLIRGLASPRESSRLGFAVALTELLSRLETVTCSQILSIILDSTKPQGSITGQEERDILFARLFGFTAVVQSGLLVQSKPLATSASASTLPSTLTSFEEMITHLLALGEKKSWLRESVWWTMGLAIDALYASAVVWKDAAMDFTQKTVLASSWSPEKIATILKLQKYRPSIDWQPLLQPLFKHGDILSTGNFPALAKILKESGIEDEEKDAPKASAVSWKPQLHYVWDAILDDLLQDDALNRPLPEFFRIVVDESLFSSTASQERKFWGFQVFQKAISRATENTMPMLFTKNLMRTWINHLSKRDRYLHKIALQTATEVQAVVQKNPRLGFTLILQLTGVHGSQQFDKLTKTKTVETILSSMDKEGIQSYIDYLLNQVNQFTGIDETDYKAINARRLWIIEQLASLVRNVSLPRGDQWIQIVLDWLTVHGLFVVKKKSSKSAYHGLRSIPTPPLSDDLRENCRTRLLGCLADLTGQSTTVISDVEDSKAVKVAAVATDGQFWVSRTLQTIKALQADSKHVSAILETDEDHAELVNKTDAVISTLSKASDAHQESARGSILLLQAITIKLICSSEQLEADAEALEACIDGASRLIPTKSKKSKKGSNDEYEADVPINVLVDVIIGFLEHPSAYMRTIAIHAFGLLSSAVQQSTVDHILVQLQRLDPAELPDEDDEDGSVLGEDEDGEEDEEEEEDDKSSASGEEDSNDDDDDDGEVDDALREKIAAALGINGIEAAEEDDESDEEELMDDDQMMAIDEQLAAVFKSQVNGKSKEGIDAQREATHFKNRVLDLVDNFLKKQPTNPLILAFLLPLTELALDSSQDEKQLSDKAQGILRSRFAKAKDVPPNATLDTAVQTLTSLHERARRGHSSAALGLLNQCSLYLAKTLIGAGAEARVVEVYGQSLEDFVTRKGSSLSPPFFLDFLRRFSAASWAIRDPVMNLTDKAVNAYRRSQVFQLLQVIVNQLSALPAEQHKDIPKFTQRLQSALLESLQGAASETISLTAPQIKEILKLALSAVRQTHRITGNYKSWDPAAWTSLGETLGANARFKSSPTLQAMCKQIADLCQSNKADDTAKPDRKKKAEPAPSSKRPVGEVTPEEGPQKKKKRKKVSPDAS